MHGGGSRGSLFHRKETKGETGQRHARAVGGTMARLECRYVSVRACARQLPRRADEKGRRTRTRQPASERAATATAPQHHSTAPQSVHPPLGKPTFRIRARRFCSTHSPAQHTVQHRPRPRQQNSNGAASSLRAREARPWMRPPAPSLALPSSPPLPSPSQARSFSDPGHVCTRQGPRMAMSMSAQVVPRVSINVCTRRGPRMSMPAQVPRMSMSAQVQSQGCQYLRKTRPTDVDVNLCTSPVPRMSISAQDNSQGYQNLHHPSDGP